MTVKHKALETLTASPEDQLVYVEHLIREQGRVFVQKSRMGYTDSAQKARRNKTILEAIRSRLANEGTVQHG